MKEPLAFRMRPAHLHEVLGQSHLTDKDKILSRCVEKKQLFSIIFYGSPGTGKTTIAQALARDCDVPFRKFNAVTGNKKELEAIFLEAKLAGGLVVIVDEIHRLNKDKQDLLLPHIEDGTLIVLGATTSNPYHAINPAIRSRCQLMEIKPLQKEDLLTALYRALDCPQGLPNTTLDADAAEWIAHSSNGDLRYAYNVLEVAALASDHITLEVVKQYAGLPNFSFDASDDGHYDAVSALQKSIRGSDVNAALYYLARLALANDMDSIERRLTVIAYEDIGLGNPAACARTITAIEAAKKVGFPEALIPLGVAVIDLALSPKSRTADEAIMAAYQLVQQHPYDVPAYLKLTPVGLAEDEKYSYERTDVWHKIQYLPNAIKSKEFYHPQANSSYETQLAKNYAALKKIVRTSDLKSLYRSK